MSVSCARKQILKAKQGITALDVSCNLLSDYGALAILEAICSVNSAPLSHRFAEFTNRKKTHGNTSKHTNKQLNRQKGRQADI